jgi:hypothetical protein
MTITHEVIETLPSIRQPVLIATRKDCTMTNLTTKHVFTFDALGSAALGILLAVFAGPLADLFGPALPSTALLVVGIGLLPWAAFNLWIARSSRYPRNAVVLNVIGDAAWVLASLALVLFAPGGLTVLGLLAVIAVGLFVLAVGLTKSAGLRSPMLAA